MTVEASGTKGGGHPAPHAASAARIPGAAVVTRATMFGPETFIVRIADDAMAPRVRAGAYAWVDPDEPAADGRLVAVRDPGRGGETVVRRLVERDGRRTLRVLDERCPERTVGADNDTDIQGVVVLVTHAV